MNVGPSHGLHHTDYFSDAPDIAKRQVIIHGTDSKIQHIDAFKSNPYEKHWWNFIINRCVEFFSGRKTSVKVQVDDEGELYVRVSALKGVLNPEEFRKITSKSETNPTNILIEHNTDKVIDEIIAIARTHFPRVRYENEERLDIRKLIDRVDYKNVKDILGKLVSNKFDEMKVINTLFFAGKELRLGIKPAENERQFLYDFSINERDKTINISREEGEKGITDHTRYDVNIQMDKRNPKIDVEKTFTPKPPPIPIMASLFKPKQTEITVKTKGIKPVQEDPLLGELNKRIDKAGLSDDDKKAIHRLAKKFGSAHLFEAMDKIRNIEVSSKVQPSSDKKLFRTFAEIQRARPEKLSSLFGMTTYKGKITTGKVKGKTKGVDETLAFAASGNKIIINITQLAKGGEKTVSTALDLYTLKPTVRQKVLTTGQDDESFEKANKQLRDEDELLKTLHDDPNLSNNLVRPYLLRVKKTSEKYSGILGFRQTQTVVFQDMYKSSVSSKPSESPLPNASIMHQLNFFKGSAKGLAYMHEKKFVHSDFKLQNVYFEGDINDHNKPVEAKIGDFGMTRKIGSKIKGCTERFTPPEAFGTSKGERVVNPGYVLTPKFDSYSLGKTILLTIKPDNKSLRGPEREIELVGIDLTHKDPDLRITCKEAAQRLEVIQKKYNLG